ncbi:MAG: leucyl/phenylalanyl-tRNA--protein transferase [Planctomycetota bacterium]|jgi:leucyl/phenylalanyl-tRNA--protein transferase
MLPILLSPGAPVAFPDPRLADEEGLVAMGGDLSTERLLHAYDHGIFPWYDESLPPLWWSPDPRAVLRPDRLHVSRSLERRIAAGNFQLTWDTEFAEVIRSCGENRSDGTWLTPDMVCAYEELHRLGHVHSLEVWYGDELGGGIYGVHRGGLFAAESMFYRRTDASKIALVALVRSLSARGVELFDIQILTEHLESMGAANMPREDYLSQVEELRHKEVSLQGLTPGIEG